MQGSVRGDWRKPVPYRDEIFARQDMRNLRNPQLERGEVRIEDIELDIKSGIPGLRGTVRGHKGRFFSS